MMKERDAKETMKEINKQEILGYWGYTEKGANAKTLSVTKK